MNSSAWWFCSVPKKTKRRCFNENNQKTFGMCFKLYNGAQLFCSCARYG